MLKGVRSIKLINVEKYKLRQRIFSPVLYMRDMYVYLAETGINRFKLSWKSAFAFHPLTKLYIAEKFVIVFRFRAA